MPQRILFGLKMKLFEFFGNYKYVDPAEKSTALNSGNSIDDRDAEHLKKIDSNHILDQVFNYIIDDDLLHKSYLLPIVVEVKKLASSGKYSREKFKQLLMPMITAGIGRFHREFNLKFSPSDIYTKELKSQLAQRLVDHYFDDIRKDEYNIGKFE